MMIWVYVFIAAGSTCRAGACPAVVAGSYRCRSHAVSPLQHTHVGRVAKHAQLYITICRVHGFTEFVYRYPHEEAGQIPVALVVRQPGSKVTEAQVMDHVAKRVAPYKKIRKVLFVESIPKSPAGKILRRQLTNHVQAGVVSRM